MSYSRVSLLTGGLGTYALPWPYLSQSHVVVYDGDHEYDGVITFPTPTTITLTPDIAGAMQIRRETPTEPLVVFTGTHLSSTDLNISKLQALYCIEERLDEIAHNFGRALRVPFPETVPEIPTRANRAGKYLVFDEGGNPVAGIPEAETIVDGSLAFLLQGDGLGTDGVAPYNMHAWNFLEGESRFQFFPARGYEVISNTSLANDFSSHKVLTTRLWNNPFITEGGFFPNGGREYGDDGQWFEYTNSFGLISTNNLTGPYPHTTGTIVGGVVTAIVVDTSAGYSTYDPLNPPNITAFDYTGSGSGFVGHANVNLDGTLTGTATIVNGGTGYGSATTQFITEPTPDSMRLDIGPQYEIVRDRNGEARSDIGALMFAHRTENSDYPNYYPASINVQPVSVDDASPRGLMMLCTANDVAISSVYPRVYIREGVVVGDYKLDGVTLMGEVGHGYMNANGYRMDNIPLENIAWQFTETITLKNGDAGAGVGPILVLYRQSPSPAAADQLGQLVFQGYNSALASRAYAALQANIINPTAAAEEGRLDFYRYVAGSLDAGMWLGQGLFMRNATGGDKGAGTINATAVYDDNVLLSCYPLELARTGTVDIEKWDAKVPDRIASARPARQEPRYETVKETKEVHTEVNGKLVVTTEEVEISRHATETVPLFDANGEPIMEKISVPVHGVMKPQMVWDRDPVTKRLRKVPGAKPSTVFVDKWVQKTVVRPIYDEIPEEPAPAPEVRIHEPMRKFLSRIGTEYDPTTLAGYVKHFKDKGHLTPMPNEAKYDPINAPLSLGEWQQRHLENAELVALGLAEIQERLKALEGAKRG